MVVKAREGDFVETVEDLLFDVKGLVHPPNRIVAFLRYFPSEKGERKRGGKIYEKVYSLSRRYKLLKKRFRQYLIHDPVFDETLCEVPVAMIKYIYKPAEHLAELRSNEELDQVEARALQFAKLLKKSADIPWSKLGVSGSILVRLQKLDSDIDLIVYGSENSRKLHTTLRTLLKDEKSSVKPYSKRELHALFDFRSKDTRISFEDFVRTECRKVLQGKFMQRDYFIRCVKDWDEIQENYGLTRYVNVGYAKIKAKITDDSEAIFTPCRYIISNVKFLEGTRVKPISEIVSFRGRFCEQAKNNETIIAQGKIEKIIKKGQPEHYRLLLGNKPTDYMIST